MEDSGQSTCKQAAGISSSGRTGRQSSPSPGSGQRSPDPSDSPPVLVAVRRNATAQLQLADRIEVHKQYSQSTLTPPTVPEAARMSAELSSAVSESEDAWRNFCYNEHPLHAATSAMLNLGGVHGHPHLHDADHNSLNLNAPSAALIYESGYNYKSSSSAASAASHPPPAPTPAPSASSADKEDHSKSVQDLWPSSNGAKSSTVDLGGSVVVISGHAGSSAASETMEVYGQSHVKKEPEDLTHRRSGHCHPGDAQASQGQKVHSSVISRALANGELVVTALESLGHATVVQMGSLGDADDQSPSSPVLHVRRPLNDDSDALDLARVGMQSSQTHYVSAGAQAFATPPGLTPIQPVHDYDTPSTYGVLSPVSGAHSRYTTINHGAIRQGNSYVASASVNSSNAAGDYYRDYFSGGDQYQTVRPSAQLAAIYAAADPHGDPVPFNGERATCATIRTVQTGTGVYKQQGTGLSVDLPSPDSGIGTDAVTPRDQSVVQQNFDYTELCNSGCNGLLTDQTGHGHGAVLDGGAGVANGHGHHHHPHAGHVTNDHSTDGSRTPTLTPTSGIGVDLHGKGAGDSPSHTPSSRSRPWHDCGRQNEADKVQIAKVYSPYGFRYYLESPISTSQRREDDRITYINKGQFYGITLEYVPDPDRPIKNQTVKSTVMLVFREEKNPEDEAKAWQFWHGRQHSVKQRILDADTKNSVGLVGCIEEVAHNAISIYWNPLESSAKINVAVQCLSTDFSSQKGVKGLPLHLQIDTFDDPRDSAPVCHRGYCQIKVFCDKGAERKTRDEERRAAKRKLAATGRNKRLDELYHAVCERSEFYAMADLVKMPALFTPNDHNDKMNPMDLQSFYSQDHERKEMLTMGVDLAANVSGVTAMYTSPVVKRRRLTPPPCERVMIYVRQENELVYTPLHLVPPTSLGLLTAIESKYKLSAASIHMLYRKNCKGILAKIDDDMLKHYCNEDSFIMEITTSTEEGMYDITLKELFDTT